VNVLLASERATEHTASDCELQQIPTVTPVQETTPIHMGSDIGAQNPAENAIKAM